MRLYIKKQCIDMIKLLKDAHGQTETYQNARNFENGFNVLNDCQSACLVIGETIEQNENQNTDKIIELLEEYCECIYQLSMSYKEVYNLKIYQKLDKLLEKVLYCIGHELPTEYDIAFLPYKASMWDSLESIWEAARLDNDCHCRVIPIPYYDKMRNGDLSEYHYEGTEFPDYVPIENYSNIDIATWKPDIIYIHNPYDDGNYVTSVYPDFYSSELKKHTDRLIYVPYYVLLEAPPDIFYQTEGVKYADTVILQSNSLIPQCIDVYSKTIDPLATKAILHNKFLALGSPKFDKVIKLGKSEMEIPDEWKNVIGIDLKKKVILYNTSLSFLFQFKEKYLLNMKRVFKEFQGQKDVVLLWRPHPLMRSSILSMLPDLLKTYDDLCDYFYDNKIGILDTTADLHRAIRISDAYYGDGGSLLCLYGITGKPMMWQFIKNTDEQIYSMYFQNIAIDGDNAWFAAMNYNALFHLDLNTLQMTYLSKLSGIDIYQANQYKEIQKYKNKLLIAAKEAEDIVIYDIDKKQLKNIPLKACQSMYEQKELANYKFSSSIVYKHWVFLFGGAYPAILRINMETETIDYFTDWKEDIINHKMRTDIYFGLFHLVNPHTIMITFCCANAVMEFDMETCEYKIHIIEEITDGLFGIIFDGSYFWIALRRQGGIIRWRPNEYMGVLNFSDSSERHVARNLHYINNKIWFIPAKSKDIIIIDPQTNQQQYLNWADEDKDEFIIAEFMHQGSLCFFTYGQASKFGKFDCNGIVQYQKYFRFDEKIASEFADDTKITLNPLIHKWSDCIIPENSWRNTLRAYFKHIQTPNEDHKKVQMKYFKALAENSDGNSGEKIHQWIKKQVIMNSD